jgi:site-specific recombinase XerD
MALYAKTHDVLLVKEALGHRSIVSTLTYARVDRDRLRAMVTG